MSIKCCLNGVNKDGMFSMCRAKRHRHRRRRLHHRHHTLLYIIMVIVVSTISMRCLQPYSQMSSVVIITGLILGLHPANERRRYKVTPSLIGWAQTKNQPCNQHRCNCWDTKQIFAPRTLCAYASTGLFLLNCGPVKHFNFTMQIIKKNGSINE